MKKFYTVGGIIETIIGFSLFLTTQFIIAVEDGYTWSKPYSQFEAQIIIIKTIGILLLVFGIINLAMVAISKYYSQKTETTVDNVLNISKQCPNCGLNVHSLTKKCPKCQNDID